jgi:hypothetical protein
VSCRDSPYPGDNTGTCRRFLPSTKHRHVCRPEVPPLRRSQFRPHFRIRFRRQSDVRGLRRGARVASRPRRYANRSDKLHTPAHAAGLDRPSVPASQLRQTEAGASKLLEVRIEWRLSSAQSEKISRPCNCRDINILFPLMDLRASCRGGCTLLALFERAGCPSILCFILP